MFSNAVTVALVALPFVAQSVLAGDCMRSYKISEGDICDSISASQNVSTYQLATINEGYIDATCSNLQPGATICLGYENEDCSSTHVVKAGDLCENIATTYSIDLTTLYNNNPNILADCSNMYIGEVLAVCSEVIVPPSGTSLVATAIPSTATAADDESLPYCDEL
ncbi:hypothetical protein BDZ89DRAFT_1024395 [Hymenopellis radicata]|nr:hypothetical protein BDZ89DRAFT_1024395 [Hymenopellis radicata]